MMTQTTDLRQYEAMTKRIRSQVSTVLIKWGLLPKFKRWRLTQDQDSRMIVLFGILNQNYIGTHTKIPYNDYFSPRLLRDLANELELQVVSCNIDGLRYAFILDQGNIADLPTHIDLPIKEDGNVVVRVVLGDISEPIPKESLAVYPIADEYALARQGIKAILKVIDALQPDNPILAPAFTEKPPAIVVIDQVDFFRRIAEHQSNQHRINHVRSLMGGTLTDSDGDISTKMHQALLYTLEHGGKLCRYPGGFWAMENWRHGLPPWFGSSTVKALVARRLMSYSEWQSGQNENFPVAAVLSRSFLST